MSNKTLNARLVNKHDTEAHWDLAINFVPLAGEIIIYDTDATHDYQRIKIGDGSTAVSALPFATKEYLSELTTDSTHRTVTDTEKNTWNSKQNTITDIDTIRSGAAAGATALQNNQGVAKAGQFVVVGSDGYITTQTIPQAENNTFGGN